MKNEEALLVLSACAIILTDGEEVAKTIYKEGDILKAKYITDFLKTYPSPSEPSELYPTK
jgi:hypothetical protein